MPATDIVRASFDAYCAGDRETAERLIAEDFVFTSAGRYRNIEFITVRDGQLVETQVFFGGQVTVR